MKTILYLCHRIPYPPNKGDKIRSFNEIKFLSRTGLVDLITLADDPKDMKYTDVLKRYCREVMVFPLNKKLATLKGAISLMTGRSISQGYFYKKEFQKAVDSLTASHKYDALICFSSPVAEYVFKSAKKMEDLADTLIMDFCDLDSDKWNQYAGKKTFPLNLLYRTEARRLLAFEKKINRKFHRSVFISGNEADLFRAQNPEAKNIDIIPNGVDHAYFNPENAMASSEDSLPVVAFFGAMDYYANVDGALWFADKILPLIKKEIPDTLFYIVGSNPDPKLKALTSDPGIKVTGFVEDIREYYFRARVCVIPLRIARGVQNKVLEAMSMSKAVVTTSPAVQGIEVYDDALLKIENDPDRFAAQVIHLLQDEPLRKKMGQAARRHIIENFNWDTNIGSFLTN
jgi:sugar transferase (PEP-CTERM/EpsH1 system associated)